MAPPLHRLLPLLLFLPYVLLRRGTSPDHQHAYLDLNPVVLVPGSSCGQLEARLTDAYDPPSPHCKGSSRWFRLWKNSTAQQDPEAAACLADQLRLVYDPAAGDYRNVAGVKTRVFGWGSTQSFLADSPADKDMCMGRLIEALERAGYRDGETLFGAPYDFRQAPAAAGQPCRAFSRFQRRLKALMEHASRTNGGKPVVLVSHSQGGLFALEFLTRSPLSWRRRHVRHNVMASAGAGGAVACLQTLASPATFPSVLTELPSPNVFGPTTPLVVTRTRNYTAHDIPEFLAAVGLPPLMATLYETRVLPMALNYRAPLVPTTCVNGVGVPTAERLVYWDGDLGGAPDEIVYGDGDGLINLPSILALDTVIGQDPRQEYYRSIKLANTSHGGVISGAGALERVTTEILRDVPSYGYGLSELLSQDRFNRTLTGF